MTACLYVTLRANEVVEDLVDLAQIEALLRRSGSAFGLHSLLLELFVGDRLLIYFPAMYISSGHSSWIWTFLGLLCPFGPFLTPRLTCMQVGAALDQ